MLFTIISEFLTNFKIISNMNLLLNSSYMLISGEYFLMISNVQLKEDDAVYECQVTATATAEGLRSRKAQLTVLCEYSRSCILLPTGSE